MRRIEPAESLILPAQVAEANRQKESNEDQKNFAGTAVPGLVLVMEQVIEIARARRMGVDRKAGAFSRAGIIEAEKGRPADGGR